MAGEVLRLVEQVALPIEFDDPVLEVFKFWKALLGHERAQLGEKRRAAIRKILKMGYTVDDVRVAIVGCKFDAWSQGENKRNKVFDDIELICRDETKLDEYMRLGDSYIKSLIAKEKKEAERVAPENQPTPMPPEVRAQLEKIFGRALKRPQS